jgi:hypothetical protein
MSRTTSIEGMHIAPTFSYKYYEKMKDTTNVSSKKEEEALMYSLSLTHVKFASFITTQPLPFSYAIREVTKL